MAAHEEPLSEAASEAGPGAFGPFDPPDDYPLEDELRGEPPRPLPAELERGRYAVRQRRGVSILLLTAAACTTFGLLPVVKEWGLYFLPLAYLDWIGIGIGVLGAGALVGRLARRGPYRYAREGVPLVARIVGLELRPTVIVETRPTTYRFFATIVYRDPETGEPRVAETTSNDVSADEKDRLTTTYRVGDYATAVYLPGDPKRSLRLYGFLDLKPGLGLVRRDAAPEGGLLQTALLVAAVFGIFGVLGWNVYAYGKYAPLELSARQAAPPLVAGAVVLGGGVLWSLAREQRRGRARLAERNAAALARGEAVEQPAAAKAGWFGAHGVVMGLILIAGALLLGGLTVLCWCYTANALLDSSPPRFRPVQIDRMVQVTHKAIFREYKIEYHFLDGAGAKREYLSTPAEMARFPTDFAVAEIHSGRFGWPWVKALHPIQLRRPGGPGR